MELFSHIGFALPFGMGMCFMMLVFLAYIWNK